jgi:hypothetical protein
MPVTRLDGDLMEYVRHATSIMITLYIAKGSIGHLITLCSGELISFSQKTLIRTLCCLILRDHQNERGIFPHVLAALRLNSTEHV